MRFTRWFLASFAASAITASQICGAPHPTEEQVQRAVALQAQEEYTRSRGLSLANKTGIEINVYLHVVAVNYTEAGDYISMDSLIRQLGILNDAFSPHTIKFKFARGEWSVQPAWSNNCREHKMKRRLRKGTYADLNVYFHASIECQDGKRIFWNFVYGYITKFPNYYMAGSILEYLDAVNVRADTVPGGSRSTFNIGLTLVHEVGHWLGLYHTFEGGCDGLGDCVSDIPPEDFEAAPEYTVFERCFHDRDTCEGGGLDLVDYYMEYSIDSCRVRFTPGQEV